MRPVGISHLFLEVRDLGRMTRFYRDTLGLTVVYEEPGVCAFLRAGDAGPALALYPGRTTPEAPSHWFFSVDVDDLESVVEELRRAGVAVGDIEAQPFGRQAKLTDPEGNQLELHTPRG